MFSFFIIKIQNVVVVLVLLIPNIQEKCKNKY